MPLDIQKLLQLQAATRKMKRALGDFDEHADAARVQLSAMPYRPAWGRIDGAQRSAIVKALLSDPNFPKDMVGHIDVLVDVILKRTNPDLWRKG